MKISKIFSITVLAVTFGLLLNSNTYADFNLTLEDDRIGARHNG